LPRKLPDLARLEWARLRALIAPDPREVVLASTIDAATFPSSRLRFAPSLELLSIDAQALASFHGTSDAAAESSARNANVTQQGVAVWRKRLSVQHEVLGPVEFEALELARTGASVSDFCAVFDSGSAADSAALAFRAVGAWFAREWIVRIE
jgi:hypothetical protein